jgi:D-proline reductase (dithiol) PrdB
MLDLLQVKDRIIARAFSESSWLFNKWVRNTTFMEYDESPWTDLMMPVTQCRLALVTTGGVHLKSQPPFNMKDSSGDPSFREIPADTCPSELAITHNYYDHSNAEKDFNIMLPLERVLALEATGEIGRVNHRHFSFMGHITDSHVSTLVSETAPKVARLLVEDEVDIVILTPA